MNRKTIELSGVGFINKGAELMLHAILQEFNDRDKYKLVTDFTVGPFEKRMKLGLYQKFRFNPLGFYPDNTGKENALKNIQKDKELYNNLDSVFIEGFGLVNPDEINVVLDASGFRYSSQWGDLKTQTFSFLYEQWSKEGKKIILLPQAFGPFYSDEIKKAFISITDSAQLICPRDEQSFNYVMDICPDRNKHKIKKFPDFTCLVKPNKNNLSQVFNEEVCIIPNYRMKDKMSDKAYTQYIKLLRQSISFLKENDIKFFFLLHEIGGNDHVIIDDLKTEVDFEASIVCEENPLKIKEIISQSYTVIGSRYHGLVSALTSGVPCIGIGWSHKYMELFKDFNIEEYLISNLEDIDSFKSILNKFFKKEIVEQTRGSLIKHSSIYKLETEKMWSLVKDVIHEK